MTDNLSSTIEIMQEQESEQEHEQENKEMKTERGKKTNPSHKARCNPQTGDKFQRRKENKRKKKEPSWRENRNE